MAFYLEAVGKYHSPPEDVIAGIRLILDELRKGGKEVEAIIEQAYLGLSNESKSGLKVKFSFP